VFGVGHATRIGTRRADPRPRELRSNVGWGVEPCPNERTTLDGSVISNTVIWVVADHPSSLRNSTFWAGRIPEIGIPDWRSSFLRDWGIPGCKCVLITAIGPCCGATPGDRLGRRPDVGCSRNSPERPCSRSLGLACPGPVPLVPSALQTSSSKSRTPPGTRNRPSAAKTRGLSRSVSCETSLVSPPAYSLLSAHRDVPRKDRLNDRFLLREHPQWEGFFAW